MQLPMDTQNLSLSYQNISAAKDLYSSQSISQCHSTLLNASHYSDHSNLKKEHEMATLQTITPCLWFDTQAEEAANYYCEVFENSQILKVTHYPTEGLADFQKD